MVPSMKHSGSLIKRAAGMDLGEIVVHYQVHGRAEGKSPRTVEWYSEVLEKLRRWLEAEGRSTLLGDVDEMTVRLFIADYQRRPGTKAATVSTHTVYNRVSGLRAFFAWLHRQKYTKQNVLKDMKQPKTAKLLIEPLNPEEIAAIFRATGTVSREGARDAAMVSLMLDTGLRIMEVAGLKEEDVHLTDRYLKVMGKGARSGSSPPATRRPRP